MDSQIDKNGFVENFQKFPNDEHNFSPHSSSCTVSHNRQAILEDIISSDEESNSSDDDDAGSISIVTECQNCSLYQQQIKSQAAEIARLKELTEKQNGKIDSLEALLFDQLQKKFKVIFRR